MRVVTLDFETHYSSEYSLNRMSPLEYVMDDRFQTISCSIKVDNYNTDVFFGEAEVRKAFKSIEKIIGQALLIAHNMSGFDAYVCAYRYKLKPRLWGCTMAMARPIHAKTTGLGLAKLVAHYANELRAMGVSPVKDNSILVSTRGKRLEDFTPQELNAMRGYNRDDTDQCHGLFDIFRQYYTPAEMWQIDAIIRMRTEPAFVLDSAMLETAASVERTRKHKALLDLAAMLRKNEDTPADLDWGNEDAVAEYVRGNLASAPKFSALLTGLGVEVPTKPSPTTPDKMVPALAKNDEAFIALQEHDDPLVAAAARARLDVKSTLLETRIQKFLTAGRLTGGMLPVPLRFCGADTTGRDSGEEYNCQNLPAIRGEPKPSHALRHSMRAGKGKKIIVADQSGIELRVNHFLWREPSTMALYQGKADADLYRASGARTYGVSPEEVTKIQRQVEKIKNLGLGFGAGAKTFVRVARDMGGLTITLEESEQYVSEWRTDYANIVEGWKTCGRALQWISDGHEYAVDPWELVTTCSEGLRLPSGRLIRYPDLRQEQDGEWPDGRPRTSWFYARGRHKARITGPKADENIVQALARDSIFDCAIDYFKLTGLRPALRVHDELVYVVDEGPAEELLETLQGVLRKPPKWWPDLVVWSEGGISDTYGDAK